MRLHGRGELAVEVAPHRPYEIGPFPVRFAPSRHSKLIFGLKVPRPASSPATTCTASGLPGTSAAPLGHHHRGCGGHAYHQGSADLDDEEIGDEPVDVFLAGVAGRSVTPRYWERILPRLDPAMIVPTHYDDFFAPLGGEEKFIRGVKLTELPGEIAGVSRDARIAALPRIDRRG